MLKRPNHFVFIKHTVIEFSGEGKRRKKLMWIFVAKESKGFYLLDPSAFLPQLLPHFYHNFRSSASKQTLLHRRFFYQRRSSRWSSGFKQFCFRMKVVALLLSVLLVAAVRGSDPGSPTRSEPSDGNIKASKGQFLCFSFIKSAFFNLVASVGYRTITLRFFI